MDSNYLSSTLHRAESGVKTLARDLYATGVSPEPLLEMYNNQMQLIIALYDELQALRNDASRLQAKVTALEAP